jgi:hypothetical protein
LVLAAKVDEFPLVREDRDRIRNLLTEFSNSVDYVLTLEADAATDGIPPAVIAYARAVQRAASDLQSRRIRQAALASVLNGETYAEPQSPRRADGSPLDTLPTIEQLSEQSGIVDEEEEEEE